MKEKNGRPRRFDGEPPDTAERSVFSDLPSVARPDEESY